MGRPLVAGVCISLLAMGAAPAWAGPVGDTAELRIGWEWTEIGAAAQTVGSTEAQKGEVEGLAGDTLFDTRPPDDLELGAPELGSDAIVLPGHSADFEAIAFNWAFYLDSPGSTGMRSADLPLTAYAIGYTRPKKGVMAATRDYNFSLGGTLLPLGLALLCIGLVVFGAFGLASLLRRRHG